MAWFYPQTSFWLDAPLLSEVLFFPDIAPAVISGEFHDETHWTITLQQPTAVQVEAASGSVCSG
jgi:hypothetical protein